MANRAREELDQQRRALGPTVSALGLSPEIDTDELIARIAGRGLEITTPAAAAGYGPIYYASAVNRLSADPGQHFLGRGETEGEALCHAAAAAFIGSETGEPPAPTPES